jgi:hypothetical protein
MNKMRIPHDNPHHTSDVYDHCSEAYLYACNHSMNSDVNAAALWHDIGKPYVKAFVDSKGNPCNVAHYYAHHNYSGWMAYGMNNSTPFRVWLVGNHMEPFFETKYYKNLPHFLKEAIDDLHECDLNAH